MNRANEAIVAALNETNDGDLNLHVMRSCRDVARKMEDVLFSVDGTERIGCTLRYFRD